MARHRSAAAVHKCIVALVDTEGNTHGPFIALHDLRRYLHPIDDVHADRYMRAVKGAVVQWYASIGAELLEMLEQPAPGELWCDAFVDAHPGDAAKALAEAKEDGPT